jgi:hypothetical protein
VGIAVFRSWSHFGVYFGGVVRVDLITDRSRERVSISICVTDSIFWEAADTGSQYNQDLHGQKKLK